MRRTGPRDESRGPSLLCRVLRGNRRAWSMGDEAMGHLWRLGLRSRGRSPPSRSPTSRRGRRRLLGAVLVAPGVEVAHHVALELLRAALRHLLVDVAGDVDDLEAHAHRLEDVRNVSRNLHVMKAAAVGD